MAIRPRVPAAVLLLALAVPAAVHAVPDIRVETAITSAEVRFFDAAGTRPRMFAYTGETKVSAAVPAVAEADLVGAARRLRRAELAPHADPSAPMTWFAAGRGLPVKVNAQDSLPAHVVTPARANPYLTRWYQRQESATDFWHWGGVMAGSQVGGAERSENAVFGLGGAGGGYPERAEKAPGGRLVWDDQQLLRSAVGTDVDPATGRSFSGTFWGLLARPSLRVEGGDGVFETDTASPPLVLQLPVRPAGLLVYSAPADPPGVDLDWSYRFDFPNRTLTVTATVKAGSRWPESGAAGAWAWTPTLFFPGWDYGGLINGGPVAQLRDVVAPWRIAADGSLRAPRRGVDAPLPPGLLDVNLPPGFTATVGEDVVAAGAGRFPSAPSPAADSSRGAATTRVENRDGVPTLVVQRDDETLAELSVPVVTVDGEPHLLDSTVLLDVYAAETYAVALYEVAGVFLDVIVAQFGDNLAYHLYDAHSTDGADHEVRLHTHLDPSIGGPAGDAFREPLYSGERYPVEAAVPQGVIDFPVGAALHSWLGSVPAVQAVDTGGADAAITHLQWWPNHTGSENALRTLGYLLADHGGVVTDPDAAVADREPIDGADVAFRLVNVYRGRIWDAGLLPWTSYFVVDTG